MENYHITQSQSCSFGVCRYSERTLIKKTLLRLTQNMLSFLSALATHPSAESSRPRFVISISNRMESIDGIGDDESKNLYHSVDALPKFDQTQT